MTLLDMFPSYTVYHFEDCRYRNAELFGYVFASRTARAKLADLPDSIGGKFCLRVPFPLAASTLICHIFHVLFVSIYKDMVGIAARWIVAFVTRLLTVWDWAMFQLVSEAVSKNSALAAIFFAAYYEYTIPISEFSGIPQPTLIGAANINFFPESFSDGAARSEIVMVALDEAEGLPFDISFLGIALPRDRRKPSATTFAITIRDFLRGIIGVHGNSPFLCLIRERFTVAARCFCCLFSFNYSTSERISPMNDDAARRRLGLDTKDEGENE